MFRQRYFLRAFTRIMFATIIFSIVFFIYMSFGYLGLVHSLETENFLGQIISGGCLVIGTLWFFAGSMIIGHEVVEYKRWGM